MRRVNSEMGFDLFLVYWLVMAGSSVSKLFKLTREAVINYKVGLVVKGEGRREKGGGKRSWVRIPLLIKLTINICQLKKKRVNKGG